jgi:hypothetical protein
MKVWLNDLNPGDKFWVCDWTGPREVEIVGPDNDPSFKMKRYKLSDGFSTFVNHYVFTTKEEAIDDFLPKLRSQLEKLEKGLVNIQTEIKMCKEQIANYEKCLN